MKKSLFSKCYLLELYRLCMLLVNMVIQINCTDAIIDCIAIYMGIIASRDELGHLPCILQGCKVFILERVTLVISS